MDLQEIAKNLHPLERKVVPLLSDKTDFNQLVSKSGLKDVEIMRALQWLSNKALVKVHETEKEVIEYYNKRGAEEKTIDVLNNDFGWNRMPFSFMEENTVFLMVMMICKNIYTWLIDKFSHVYSGLKKNFRLKKFIFRFITVPVKWIKSGGQLILKIFSNRPYEVLQT